MEPERKKTEGKWGKRLVAEVKVLMIQHSTRFISPGFGARMPLSKGRDLDKWGWSADVKIYNFENLRRGRGKGKQPERHGLCEAITVLWDRKRRTVERGGQLSSSLEGNGAGRRTLKYGISKIGEVSVPSTSEEERQRRRTRMTWPLQGHCRPGEPKP